MSRQRSTKRDGKHRVAGEDARDLLPLLTRFADNLVQNEDGTFQVHVEYSKDEAPPLVRALMRIEAELLLDDARRLQGPDAPWRSPKARTVDAVLLLALRTRAALGQPVDAELLMRIKAGRHQDTHEGVL